MELECLLGLRCNDFAMMAADQTNARSIMVMRNDAEKLHKISDNIVLGVNGDSGDTAQFSQYVAKNVQLYKMRNLYPLGVDAVVHFTRRNLADSVRSRTPYMVNLLFAGYDEQEGGQLYYMDFLASCIKVPFAAHGFGGHVSMGILDRYHKPTLTELDAYQILIMCVKEIDQRLLIKLPNFQVNVVNKDGVKQMPIISASGRK